MLLKLYWESSPIEKILDCIIIIAVLSQWWSLSLVQGLKSETAIAHTMLVCHKWQSSYWCTLMLFGFSFSRTTRSKICSPKANNLVPGFWVSSNRSQMLYFHSCSRSSDITETAAQTSSQVHLVSATTGTVRKNRILLLKHLAWEDTLN